MSLDITRLRAETPGCDRVCHFNNAGAALMPAPVIDAVKNHIDLEACMGGYEAAAVARDEHLRAHAAAAELIGAAADEIALLENASVAWMMAFYGIAATFAPGDRILTAEAEYAANYVAYMQAAKRTGAEIVVVPSDETGALSVPALENLIDDRVKLISITHVPTNGGLVNPAAAVGRVARAAGIPYLLDACQSVGQFPVNVDEIGCDMLSVTGRKYLRGPRGTGFLYMRRALFDRFEPPMIDHFGAPWIDRDHYQLRDDARRFETWENNIAGQIGLGVALDYALDLGIEAIGERNFDLATHLRRALAAVSGVAVTDLGPDPGAIVTFTVAGVEPMAVKAALAEQGINVSVSDLSSTRIDMENRGLRNVVRASVHYYNTENEIASLVEAVDSLAG